MSSPPLPVPPAAFLHLLTNTVSHVSLVRANLVGVRGFLTDLYLVILLAMTCHGFSFRLPNDGGSLAHFHVHANHVNIFFGETMFIQVICPFFNWTICFLAIELYEFLT